MPETPDVIPAKTAAESSPDKVWRSRIAACEALRTQLYSDWKENVNFRVMQPFGESSDTDRVALTEDWARTKAKTADLAFRLPRISALANRPEFEKSVPRVTAQVNQKLKQAGTAYVVDECLADVINATGIMAAVVGMDTRFETKLLPKTDETGQPVLGPDGAPMTEPVKRPVWRQPTVDRISTVDLLWPAEFRGSNWQKARWLGYQVDMTETRIKDRFKVPDDWEAGEDGTACETLATDVQKDPSKGAVSKTARVSYVFYYAAEYDADKVHPQCIRYHIFVEGVEAPVESGDVPDQVWIPESPALPGGVGPDGQPTPGSPAVPAHYEGLTRLPILVETLVYVSDLAVPPSDSQVGRSGVRELMRSRSQMIRQRDFSVPIRWYDTNRVDETIIEQMRQGRWQDMVPVNGPGDRAFGEVSRAAYPRENFSFDSVIKQGLDMAWSTSNNQVGLPNAETKSATEVASVDSSTRKRADYERERVNRFVVGIGEVLFSLMQRYEVYDSYVTVAGPDGADVLEEFKLLDLKQSYEFDFVADNTEGLDLATRQAHSVKVYNLAANSPSANRRYLEAQMFRLHGLDPARAQNPPAPPAPDKANISYRFGGEDMLNPIAIAILLKNQEITPKEIEAAALLIQDAVTKARTIDASIVPPGHMLGGPPPAGAPPQKVVPPEMNEPILKRAGDGTHLT